LITNERLICLKCYLQTPKNQSIKIFFIDGKEYELKHLYKFQKKGIIQNLIHKLKYCRNKSIGYYLGQELLKLPNILSKIDGVIPVPIHENKKKKRGYNQSEIIAQGLVKGTTIPIINNVLYRKQEGISQTQKNRFRRFNEIDNAFEIKNPHLLQNKHIILVDDISTTGATLSACVKTLNRIKNINVSLACIASA